MLVVAVADDPELLALLLLTLLPRTAAEIVSSKELNFVKFIIQPSILRNSLSSVTFCQDTFSVVDETASTITSSGCPGNVLMPSATPIG